LCRTHSIHLDFMFLFFQYSGNHGDLHSFPTRRSSDLKKIFLNGRSIFIRNGSLPPFRKLIRDIGKSSFSFAKKSRRNMMLPTMRSEEHTSELQSRENLVCRLLLEKKKKQHTTTLYTQN